MALLANSMIYQGQQRRSKNFNSYGANDFTSQFVEDIKEKECGISKI
jgi:hypothetical protein